VYFKPNRRRAVFGMNSLPDIDFRSFGPNYMLFSYNLLYIYIVDGSGMVRVAPKSPIFFS
jgi:hypothetical protein